MYWTLVSRGQRVHSVSVCVYMYVHIYTQYIFKNIIFMYKKEQEQMESRK